MAEYIITQEDLDKGNDYLKTLTTEHPVCRIADGVTTIGKNAFLDCTSLTSITIPNSVTSIGGAAFQGCTSLTSINIPDGVTSIGKFAFFRCTSLTSITIPDSVTSIGGGAFYDCSSLTSITIGNGVTTIGINAFYNCSKLTSITIPYGVTSIEDSTFYGCSKLESIKFEGLITSIGNKVFDNCSSLKTIYVAYGFNTSILDGKIPSGVTIVELPDMRPDQNPELITLKQLKIYDYEKTKMLHNSFTTNNLEVENVFTHKGFDVASTKVISEDDYNNLGAAARNDAFYVTSPNGNMYFMGMRWAPSYIPVLGIVAYVDLPKMANDMTSLTTSTLTFTSGAVTNSFVNGGAYNGIYKKTSVGEGVDSSLSIGTQANDGSVITNANELYITNAIDMYRNCQKLTDTFICNPALITNAPTGYDVMKYCTNMVNTFHNCTQFNHPVNIPDSVISMWGTFENCYNFNQPVKIGNNVTDMSDTFRECYNFNQPVKIGNNVIGMDNTFYNCTNFNQPVNIPDSVTEMWATFFNCTNFNQPVKIGNSVTDMWYTFYNCYNFNQPVKIGNSVTNMSSTFYNCYNFNQPVNIPAGVTSLGSVFQNCTTLASSTVPIHISRTIALGDTSNYIYNSLVNGYAGISFAPSRILNDL